MSWQRGWTEPVADTRSEIEAFVADERAEYENTIADGRFDDLEDLVTTTRNRSRWIALGMLYLGEVEEAQEWLAMVAPAFVDASRRMLERIDTPETTAAGPRPWSDLYKGIQAATLSGDDEVQAETVDGVRQLVTDPLVEKIPDSSHPYIGLIRTLTALLDDHGDADAAIEDLRERIAASDDPDDEAFFAPPATAIDGLYQDDSELVRKGIDELLAWHDRVITSRDEHELVEEGIDPKAAMFLVLAHRRGLNVHVDSEYLPEAVYELA